MRFENKVALITGAAVGIGRAAALCMAQQGAALALLDMDAAALQAVVEECRQLHVQAECWTCDISDEDRVKQVVSAAEEPLTRTAAPLSALLAELSLMNSPPLTVRSASP